MSETVDITTLPGIAVMRGFLDGSVPPPGALTLLGMRMVSAEIGSVTMSLNPGPHHANPMGVMHGGILATLLDSVMGCSVHSTLPAGRIYTTLEIKVNYLRGVTPSTGTITATGTVVHAGRRSAVAEARVTDAAGKLIATASTTCLIMETAA